MAVEAIHNEEIAGCHVDAGVFQTDDGRNFECAGQNGRVRCRSAHVGHDAKGVGDIDLGGIRGGQVVGDDNTGSSEVFEVLQLRVHEFAKNPRANIQQVVCALAEHGVVGFFESLGVPVHQIVEQEFDVELLVFEAFNDFFSDRDVVEHHQMGFEDAGVPLPQFLGSLIIEPLQIAAKGFDSYIEALKFLPWVGDGILGHIERLHVEGKGRPDGDTGRYANSSQSNLHLVLSESRLDKFPDRVQGLFCIGTAALDSELGALRRRQREHAHNTLCVDLSAIQVDVDLTFEGKHRLDQLGSGPRMYSQRVDDRHFFSNTVFCHMNDYNSLLLSGAAGSAHFGRDGARFARTRRYLQQPGRRYDTTLIHTFLSRF